MYKVIGLGILFTIICAIIHGINWLLTKGIIFVAFALFNVNWYDKFWAVYICLFLFNFLIKNTFKFKGSK